MNETMKAASKRLSRFLVTNRQTFRRNGYQDDMQVVLAVESDLINDVMDRVQAHEPPVVIAVYFPNRVGKDEFTFIQIEPSVPVSELLEPLERVTGTATIGMFADDLEGRGPGKVFPFNIRRSWSNMNAKTFAHA